MHGILSFIIDCKNVGVIFFTASIAFFSLFSFVFKKKKTPLVVGTQLA